MKTRLTLALAMAVSAGTVTFVVASSFKHEQASAAEPIRVEERTVTLVRPLYQPRSEHGPRIIVVPQPGDRASVDNRDRQAALDDGDDDEEIAPPAPSRSKPRAAVPRWQPRTETKSPPPPPATPPRKVLGAAKSIHDGPTPIRPLPRYNTSGKSETDSKAETGEKFAPPNPPVTVSSAPPPRAELMHAEETPPAAATPDEDTPPGTATHD